MAVIPLRGVPIACVDTGAPPGRPDAPTVVFGHGLLFGGWMFRDQIATLRARYRCVTIDWRGHGLTPPTATGYDMDTLTGDALALLDHLDAGPVHWVGLSMGGFVGQRLAARHGDRLRSLTLLDTSAGPEDPAAAAEYARLAWALHRLGHRFVLPRAVPHLFGPVFLADPANEAVLAEWRARLRRCDRAATRRAVLAVARRDPVEHELPAVTVPTLVAVGADDRATPPPRAADLAARIPGARLHVVPACGHTSTLERSTEITALLRDFLAEADNLPS
ncbi:alpha/beta fold hydrolase [Nocardia thailandica]